MDEAFVNLMKEFIEVSLRDREENKQVLKETRTCLTNIRMQLIKLETQSELDVKLREERRQECKTKHEKIDIKLKNIPTEKEKSNLEDKVKDLENLKPFIYKMMGILGILSIIAIPIAKKLGLF